MGLRRRVKGLFCWWAAKKVAEGSSSHPVEPGRPEGAAEEEVAIGVPELSLHELNETTGFFASEKLIGQGSHAKVYSVVLPDARRAVVKKLEKPSEHASNDEFLKQLSVTSRLKHENFIELLGYAVAGDLRVLAYEFATVGSLHDVLHGKDGAQEEEPRPVLSWERRARVALDAARGLEYLHEKVQTPVTHKGIRSTNILLFEDMRAKVADYNLFSQASDMARLNRSVHTLGSFGYHAPEYAMTGVMTSKSDVYSFGIVLLELLTGRKPLDRTLPPGQRSLVNWATPMLTEDRVKECMDPKLGSQYPPTEALKLGKLAVHCLQYDPTFRPAMSTVIRVIQSIVASDQPGTV